MTPARARAYAKAVLVPLVTAGVVAWSEHRAAQNKERQDVTFASALPALKELQAQHNELAKKVNDLTLLLAEHVTHHQAAVDRRRSLGTAGAGGGGSGLGSGLPMEQVTAAAKLKDEPPLPLAKRPIPSSPDEALRELKR